MRGTGTEEAPIIIDDEENDTLNNTQATPALTRKNSDIDWVNAMQTSPGYTLLRNMGYVPGKALGPDHSERGPNLKRKRMSVDVNRLLPRGIGYKNNKFAADGWYNPSAAMKARKMQHRRVLQASRDASEKIISSHGEPSCASGSSTRPPSKSPARHHSLGSVQVSVQDRAHTPLFLDSSINGSTISHHPSNPQGLRSTQNASSSPPTIHESTFLATYPSVMTTSISDPIAFLDAYAHPPSLIQCPPTPTENSRGASTICSESRNINFANEQNDPSIIASSHSSSSVHSTEPDSVLSLSRRSVDSANMQRSSSSASSLSYSKVPEDSGPRLPSDSLRKCDNFQENALTEPKLVASSGLNQFIHPSRLALFDLNPPSLAPSMEQTTDEDVTMAHVNSKPKNRRAPRNVESEEIGRGGHASVGGNTSPVILPPLVVMRSPLAFASIAEPSKENDNASNASLEDGEIPSSPVRSHVPNAVSTLGDARPASHGWGESRPALDADTDPATTSMAEPPNGLPSQPSATAQSSGNDPIGSTNSAIGLGRFSREDVFVPAVECGRIRLEQLARSGQTLILDERPDQQQESSTTTPAALFKHPAPDPEQTLVMRTLPFKLRDPVWWRSWAEDASASVYNSTGESKWASTRRSSVKRVLMDASAGIVLIEFKSIGAAIAAFRSPRLEGKHRKIRAYWYVSPKEPKNVVKARVTRLASLELKDVPPPPTPPPPPPPLPFPNTAEATTMFSNELWDTAGMVTPQSLEMQDIPMALGMPSSLFYMPASLGTMYMPSTEDVQSTAQMSNAEGTGVVPSSNGEARPLGSKKKKKKKGKKAATGSTGVDGPGAGAATTQAAFQQQHGTEDDAYHHHHHQNTGMGMMLQTTMNPMMAPYMMDMPVDGYGCGIALPMQMQTGDGMFGDMSMPLRLGFDDNKVVCGHEQQQGAHHDRSWDDDGQQQDQHDGDGANTAGQSTNVDAIATVTETAGREDNKSQPQPLSSQTVASASSFDSASHPSSLSPLPSGQSTAVHREVPTAPRLLRNIPISSATPTAPRWHRNRIANTSTQRDQDMPVAADGFQSQTQTDVPMTETTTGTSYVEDVSVQPTTTSRAKAQTTALPSSGNLMVSSVSKEQELRLKVLASRARRMQQQQQAMITTQITTEAGPSTETTATSTAAEAEPMSLDAMATSLIEEAIRDGPITSTIATSTVTAMATSLHINSVSAATDMQQNLAALEASIAKQKALMEQYAKAKTKVEKDSISALLRSYQQPVPSRDPPHFLEAIANTKQKPGYYHRVQTNGPRRFCWPETHPDWHILVISDESDCE